MMGILDRNLFALLAGFALVILQVHAQQPGFISIDCGANSSYTDPQTGIFYVPDSTFIETGMSYSVKPVYQLATVQPVWTLRSFPEGTKNCYNVKTTKDGRYLIRATFMYGNYDDEFMVPGSFDLYLGANLWDSVVLGNVSTILFKEIIHVSPSNYIDVCLVNTGNGTPLISSLEFRLLKNNTYVTEYGSLAILARMNVLPISNEILRYPDDVYDRRWVPFNYAEWELLNTSLTIDANDFQPPQIVMKKAGRQKNASDPLKIIMPIADSTKIYVYMHFAELEVLQANQSRKFNVSFNGNYLTGPVSPNYLSTNTVYSTSALSGEQYEFSLTSTEDSTLPPILNAVEFYLLKEFPQSETNQVDVDAIKNIKSLYKRKDWQGDPCAPQAYLWMGLDCSYKDNDPPRIISLNLSSNGLTGDIPSYLANLTVLRHLDLSNNSLTGAVPEFLSKLSSLTTLNLEGNNLTGSVPAELLDRAKSGSLTLSVDGNPNLCTSASCSKTKKKKKVVVPVVASFASLLILVTVLATFWRLRRAKQGKGDRSRYGSMNRRFTYAELSMITNNFKKVLGEGSFGKVYHGCLDDDTEVAVKMLSESSCQGYDEFAAEVKLLLTVHHKNLVTLYGYCDEGKQIGLVYEFMANGNLKEHLSARNVDVMSWEGRLQAALEAAQGLEYLHHGCKTPRVHRDIKSANILLNDKFQAKIADFGLIRTFPVEDVTHVSTGVAGTFGYLDPEYCQSYRLNEKSDVYSFGVVILETITSRPVIANTNENTHISQWVRFMLEQGDIKNIVDPRLRGNFNINSAWKAVEIAMASVSETSAGRPTMKEVVVELKQCLEMERARKKGQYGTESRGQHIMVSLNLSTELNPVAR